MKNILYILFIFFFSSCVYNEKHEVYLNPNRNIKKPLSGKKILISGCLSGLKAKKIYIFQHPFFEQLLDSADIKKDSFSLIIDSSILLDINDIYGIKVKGEDGRIFRVFFYNHVLSTKAQKYLNDAFIIDTNFITINGNKSFDSGLVIKASVTNDSHFRIQMLPFGYLSNDSAKRKNEMEKYLSIIKEYPSSQYLLSQIDENKSVIQRDELAQLLQGFDQSAIRSNIGKKMLAYLAKKTDNQQMTDMVLEDDNGKASSVLNTTGKVNMLVIWASWCGPCRREIPGLKKLYDKYKDRGLTITSVSTDENRASWKAALFVESMPWKQLIVPKDKIELFNLTYEVGSIPYVLFLDDKGKVITRSIGFDENTSGEYESIIAKYIK
jgi:thiol-disulfide isomerase/thioredoxin